MLVKESVDKSQIWRSEIGGGIRRKADIDKALYLTWRALIEDLEGDGSVNKASALNLAKSWLSKIGVSGRTRFLLLFPLFCLRASLVKGRWNFPASTPLQVLIRCVLEGADHDLYIWHVWRVADEGLEKSNEEVEWVYLVGLPPWSSIDGLSWASLPIEPLCNPVPWRGSPTTSGCDLQ